MTDLFAIDLVTDHIHGPLALLSAYRRPDMMYEHAAFPVGNLADRGELKSRSYQI
jgi:hypothetical protein